MEPEKKLTPLEEKWKAEAKKSRRKPLLTMRIPKKGK
jgi:hypothetical protein